MIDYVIPCGGAKLDRAAPARDLYTGSMFRHTLTNVERCAAGDEAAGLGPVRILILSAKYGLVQLDDVLEPYDLKMGKTGSVTAETLAEQAYALGIDYGAEVYALLPKRYLQRLDEALRTLYVYVQDVYEACGGPDGRDGIGPQRRVNAIIGRPDTASAAPGDGDGLQVWIGGDVHTFAWGLPILVSYGRLRRYTATLPVAHAPWVCDSRGFKEIDDHGTWTIPVEEYAADLRQYATEIGQLEWAVPQDWPAAAHLLAKTGLTEEEHQIRTIQSVLQLREMLPSIPIICVVTGKDLDGYLRHIRMYLQHGIDLRAEKLVVGVGALVGRRPQEAADIIRAIHAAGVQRLHGFGVKGPVLDLAGDLLESIDSANWSGDARYTVGLCRHGKGIKHESNCPDAALEWAAGQRERARGGVRQMELELDLDELFEWSAAHAT